MIKIFSLRQLRDMLRSMASLMLYKIFISALHTPQALRLSNREAI